MRTWIVAPVYRDTTSFEILRERLLVEAGKTSEGESRNLRFVVVDDTAGQDLDVDALREFEDVTVIQPPFNLGHQRALVYGLRKILPVLDDEDLIVTLDADGEDRPEDLPRLLAPLEQGSGREPKVVLALRTRRRESLGFKVMYLLFRLLFRMLTGTTVRTGNYAAVPGSVAKRVLVHPTFDLAYSSALLAIDVPREFVPCERGKRYAGESRMTFGRLSMHGLRMLMPFTDRIAGRALLVFVLSLLVGLSMVAAVVAIKLFSDSAIPGWATFTAIGALLVSLVSLGNFVSLFVLFSQTRAVSLANIEEATESREVVSMP